MKHKTSDEQNLYILGAAYLASQKQLQKDIADNLDISQPEVSRLLKRAEKNGWLEPAAPKFACYDPELIAQMKAKFFSSAKVLQELRKLEKRSAGILKQVFIHQSCRENQFEPDVAKTIETLVMQADILGVTWGPTLSELVCILRKQFTQPLRKQNPIQIVPLCGEPFKERHEPLKFSSTALAVEFHQIINGTDEPHPPTLAGVQAFIPLCFKASEAETIREFISLVAGYGAVFGGDSERGGRQKEPWVDQADTVLTSIGVVRAKKRGVFQKERTDLGDITEQQLTDWVVGDIGGIMIHCKDLEAAPRKHIKELNERWTGIKLEHLRACARNAARGNRPGIIVLAIGAARAAMVRRCIEEGLVNQLIIDRQLAGVLEDPSSVVIEEASAE